MIFIISAVIKSRLLGDRSNRFNKKATFIIYLSFSHVCFYYKGFKQFSNFYNNDI